MAEGRDAQGHFVKGHKGGPGRRRKKPEDKYLKVFSSTVKVEDFRQILLTILSFAKAGDVGAARLILEHGLGKPPQRVTLEAMPGDLTIELKWSDAEVEPDTPAAP